MNNERKNFLLGIITGIFLCVAGGAAYLYLPSALSQKSPQELTIDMAFTRINNKDFKEAVFKRSQVEFTDANGAKWTTAIASDPTREALYMAVSDFNSRNPGATIKTTEDSISGGGGWFFMIQIFPFVLFGLFAITAVSLAILAYKALFNKRVEK